MQFTKENWQWRQGYLFIFESYRFDKKIFLYICACFSLFILRSLLKDAL